jgi:hypothetical protein
VAEHRRRRNRTNIGRNKGNWARDGCLTSGRSSGRLGAVFGELDGRENGHGSPAASGGKGRARERARVCEMRRRTSAGHWRGSKKGVGARGRASWSRNPATCVSVHAPVHGERGEGETDTAGPRRRERKRDARGNGSAAGDLGPRDRERVNGRRKLAATGWSHRVESERERGRARARTATVRRGPPIRRRGRAAWLG